MEAELLVEEVAISESTSLESALENLKIQVGGLGVSSLSLRVVASWLCIRQFAKPSCEFCRIGRQEQPSQLNTCVTCPHPP